MSYPTIYLRGMREIDDDFEKMLAVRDAYYEAGVVIPDEVNEYFGGDYDEGVLELLNRKFAIDIVGVDGGSGSVIPNVTNSDLITENKELAAEDSVLIDIDLKKLPTALKTLQLEVTW